MPDATQALAIRMLPAMTTATPVPADTPTVDTDPVYRRYARRIDLLDHVAMQADQAPVHVLSRALVDGKPLPPGAIESEVGIECSRTDGTRVSLSVRAGDLRVQPLDIAGKFRVFLGEHEFLTPPDGVDIDALEAAGDDEYLPLTVFAAEVHVGPPAAT